MVYPWVYGTRLDDLLKREGDSLFWKEAYGDVIRHFEEEAGFTLLRSRAGLQLVLPWEFVGTPDGTLVLTDRDVIMGSSFDTFLKESGFNSQEAYYNENTRLYQDYAALEPLYLGEKQSP